jgi:hypothetical protein
VHDATGLLPHLNPGHLTPADVAALRGVSVSQGLMLESASERLCAPGGPHHGSPDKHPRARLASIRAAGEQRVPFTSGMLIGIGETREERIDSLLALRELNDAYGHIQEIIIQNFRPKVETRMAHWPAPPLDELLWTIAIARLLFAPSMNIQAPPNLNPGVLSLDRRRHQRLGRRVAGHAGSRQSRGAVAGPGRPRARHQRRRQATGGTAGDLSGIRSGGGYLGRSRVADRARPPHRRRWLAAQR